MIMTTNITETNFKARLKGFGTSASNMRQSAQDLIAFGLNHYAGDGNGDTGYLSRLMGVAENTKGINASAIRQYILDHANLKFGRDKAKNPVFRKIEKGAEPEVTTPEVNWWQHKREAAERDNTVRVAKRIESLVNAMTRADDAGTPVDLDGARAALKALQEEIDNRATPQLANVEPGF